MRFIISYKTYVKKAEIINMKEIDKILYTGLYIANTNDLKTFSINEAIDLLSENGIHISNVSRIKSTIKLSKFFKNIKGDVYALSSSALKKLVNVNDILKDEETIDSSGDLLDLVIFKGHSKCLDKLVDQANHCYESNCYDACSSMLRRILEMLLIESYENMGIEVDIKDSNGNYYMLEKICANAKNNTKLNLSRERKKLDSFRNLGNYASHKRYYNTTKQDVDNLRTDLRVILEELLYKSNYVK